MLGHLSLYIISFLELTVFLELCSRKTVRFSKQRAYFRAKWRLLFRFCYRCYYYRYRLSLALSISVSVIGCRYRYRCRYFLSLYLPYSQDNPTIRTEDQVSDSISLFYLIVTEGKSLKVMESHDPAKLDE